MLFSPRNKRRAGQIVRPATHTTAPHMAQKGATPMDTPKFLHGEDLYAYLTET